jgi:hypothetical protein
MSFKFYDDLQSCIIESESWWRALIPSFLRRMFQMRHKDDSLMGTRKTEVGIKQRQGVPLTPEDEAVLKYQTGVDPELNRQVALNHGDMLVMGGAMQQFWRHRITQETVEVGPRIVFTFRSVAKDSL